MKVYLVGHCDPEHNHLSGVYSTPEKALIAFNEIRLELLEEAKRFLKGDTSWEKTMWKDMIKKLSEIDPNKIDNYPHDTPYINEEEVQ